MAPNEWVTDKIPAYSAALWKPNLHRAAYIRRSSANNRAEAFEAWRDAAGVAT
jgi:hypothetical protein